MAQGSDGTSKYKSLIVGDISRFLALERLPIKLWTIPGSMGVWVQALRETRDVDETGMEASSNSFDGDEEVGPKLINRRVKCTSRPRQTVHKSCRKLGDRRRNPKLWGSMCSDNRGCCLAICEIRRGWE